MQGWIHRGLLGQYQAGGRHAGLSLWANRPQAEGDWVQVEFDIKEQRMTIEKLAEMGYEAAHKSIADAYEVREIATPWHKLNDVAQGAHIANATAVATAVLGPVTYGEDNGLTWDDISAFNRVAGKRLASLTQSKQPAADASKADVSDDEVERAAKAMWAEQRRWIGFDRSDEDTWDIAEPSDKKNRFRSQARAALSAVNRGERWGVWCKKHDAWVTSSDTGEPVKTDAIAAAVICRLIEKVDPCKYELRPYPSTPQVQVPEDAVEAAARSLCDFSQGEGEWERMTTQQRQPYVDRAKLAITAALPHLQRGVTK